ncbi:MAG: hypothetical protein AUI52_05530 [Acidobacteria bacterium 13_1_40CM_2_68_10]|nr:MAG: hypothetical protein AUI52_05530 [Acidobacteria bacterium 13_1_40CM_2_68_10]
MTTLLAVRAPAFHTIRCNALCHNAKSRRCNCVCDGLYHGLGSGTPALQRAVVTWQRRLLLLYGESERQWHCVIEFAREDLHGPPVIRHRGKTRDLQVPLPLG